MGFHSCFVITRLPTAYKMTFNSKTMHFIILSLLWIPRNRTIIYAGKQTRDLADINIKGPFGSFCTNFQNHTVSSTPTPDYRNSFLVFIIKQCVLIFFISELTYNHTIKLDDEALTFDIRDAIEKVWKLVFVQKAFPNLLLHSCVDNFTNLTLFISVHKLRHIINILRTLLLIKIFSIKSVIVSELLWTEHKPFLYSTDVICYNYNSIKSFFYIQGIYFSYNPRFVYF